MGFREPVRHSTLADANQSRDWRIRAAFAQRLIDQARSLYAQEDLGLELTPTVYALDSSTLDLCRSIFPWARFRTTIAAVKMRPFTDQGIPANYPEMDGNSVRAYKFVNDAARIPTSSSTGRPSRARRNLRAAQASANYQGDGSMSIDGNKGLKK